MSTGMTYTTLLSDLRDFLERGFTSASDPIVFQQLPRRINLAEQIIARELKVQGVIVPMVFEMEAGNDVYDKPDRWRETVSMAIGTGTDLNSYVYLFPRSYEYIRSCFPDNNVTAQPGFYADYDQENWLIGPCPDMDYPVNLIVYQMPSLLDDTNQSNWLTEYAPQVILYRALLECTPFLKNDERIPVWQQNYDRAVQVFQGEDIRKILDRSAVRREA